MKNVILHMGIRELVIKLGIKEMEIEFDSAWRRRIGADGGGNGGTKTGNK